MSEEAETSDRPVTDTNAAAARSTRAGQSDAGGTPDVVSYTDAVAELDAILRRLEGSDVDVDRLAEQVARAAELISVCRQRIAAARISVERVTADLDAAVDLDRP